MTCPARGTARRRVLTFGALLTTAALTATACSGTATGDGADGDDAPDGQAQHAGTLEIGVDRAPNSFDPLQSFLGGQYMQQLDPVYDTLIRAEPDGSFSPGLATEWSYLDNTSFEMHLREDVVFADGTTEFNGDAVKANLDRLYDVVGPQTSDLSSMYDSTEVVDDHHVIIHLTSPNPDLERILAQLIGMMVNPQAFGDSAADEALGSSPQGSGPYVLDEGSTVVNDTYVYTKNEHYWDSDAFPYDELRIKSYADPNAMLAAVETGEVALGYGSPATYDTATGFGLGVATRPVNVAWLAFNDRDAALAPPLAEQEVRQALNHAVDREAILETVFHGQGETTVQVFANGVPGYDPELDDRYPYDLDQARSLLADAGYEDGFTFEVGVAFPDRDGALAEALASGFSEIGVTMEITAMPPGAFSADEHKVFPAVIHAMGTQGAYSDGQLLLQPTGTIWNPHDSENDLFYELWEEGTQDEDPASRLATYEELSAEVVEAAWWAPIVNVNAIYYFDQDVFEDTPFSPGLTVPQIHNWELTG